MRKIFIYSIILLFAMNSCQDFLEVRAVGSVDENTLSNEFGINLAMNAMYASFHQTRYFEAPLTNYVYGDVMGGSANKGTTFNDQSDFTNLEVYSFTTDNSYLNWKWRSVYDGVFRANNMMNIASGVEEKLSAIEGKDNDFYTETIAQGRFFRGFWHFEGIKLYGAAIPYVGLEDFQKSVNPEVSNVDESGNYIYIWQKVIDDLQFAYDNLPDTWGAGQQGRINKWAAGALLAKVKAYQSSPYNGKNGTANKWGEVKTLLETVMANGKDNKGTSYKLADTYESLYIAGESDWTGESVLDIQMAISGTQTNTNAINGSSHIGMTGIFGTGGWGFYQPSNDMVNSYIVDADGLPYINEGYKNFDALTLLEGSIPKTDLEVFTDPRLDISVGRFEVPYYDWAVPIITDGWVRDVSNGGLYLNKKNLPKKSDKGSLSVATSSGSTAKNFHLIRYADLLLLYAEALIETGNPQGAMAPINEVRARAANAYIKAVDPATMAESTSDFVLEDLVNGETLSDAAANYRIGIYPTAQFASKESATAALRFERKLELALEGHRWYDLARWGIVADELNKYVDYESQYLSKYANSVYNEDWVTLPIPFNQIITMQGVLVQNENWK